MAARDMILDAAATVIRSKGIARATTKEIAREAGCSEALLYKHFVDKQGIYLAALKERLLPPGDDVEPGSGDVHDNLVDIVVDLMASYVATFPMSASIFSDRDLLAAWRAGMAERGAGPRGPVRMIERYLDGELTLGRVAPQTDSAAIAALLCGAAFQAAFLACYDGLPEVSDGPALAERLVSASFGA